MKYPGDPGFTYLDEEEKELIEETEANIENWKPLEGAELAEAKEKFRAAAKNTLEKMEIKTERMNIRMTKPDLDALKSAASREGLPYQSLVTSILHKYTQGRLVDIEEARKLLKT